jgi:phosphate transport system ATP-binding protein
LEGSTVSKIRRSLKEIVERSLIDAALWDEVKDRLDSSALGLSEGSSKDSHCQALAVELK